jgi:hypothetical protein
MRTEGEAAPEDQPAFGPPVRRRRTAFRPAMTVPTAAKAESGMTAHSVHALAGAAIAAEERTPR